MSNEENKNQCDGCVAGYPVNANNIHIFPYPSGPMMCKKKLYELSLEELKQKGL